LLENKDLESMTLDKVHESFMAGKDCERQNNIIDFAFDINSVLSGNDKDPNLGPSLFAMDNSDPELYNTSLSTSYKPEVGFFKQFELIGGVKKFISVAQSSTNKWKNKKMAELWASYLKELESFSEIPCFFQIFMKSNFGKDLLFKIVNGLPD
jgi:hypothetical protein